MNSTSGKELPQTFPVKQIRRIVARREHLQECKERQTRLAAMTLDNYQLAAILNERHLWVMSYQPPWVGPHALEHLPD